MTAVSDRVKALLAHFNWKGAELARQCNVKRAAVSKWVRGESKPRLENLLPLRKKHRVNEQWVLYGFGEMIIPPGAEDPRVLRAKFLFSQMTDEQVQRLLDAAQDSVDANRSRPSAAGLSVPRKEEAIEPPGA